MTTRWPGGIIRATAPTVVGPTFGEGGSTSGIWTKDQADYYIANSTWPKQNVIGSVFGWGPNASGQLGLGDIVARNTPARADDGDSGYSNNLWATITTGSSSPFSLAIKQNGTLWAWGYNLQGNLGLGNSIYRSSPIQIGISDNWLSVSAGDFHATAVKKDGTLWSWGKNDLGMLGQNNIITLNTPVKVGTDTNWLTVSNSRNTSYAIKSDGTLWAWGQNNTGALGDNTVIYRSSPVQIGALTNWSSIVATGINALALKTDKTLWGWGGAAQGNLALGDTVGRSSPVQVGTAIIPTKISSVPGGAGSNLILRNDGKIVAIGDNGSGQLGIGSVTSIYFLKEIGLTTHTAIFSGAAFSVAVRTNGTLWSWGKNDYGQSGKNVATTTLVSSPTQVGALTNWSSLGGTTISVAAIKTDGTLWCWGSGTQGMVADNNAISRSSPVQVGLLTDWSYVTSGYGHVLALKTNGTLWAWGSNANGALGLNTAAGGYRSSPVQIGADTNWSSVAAGYLNSMAIKTDGTLWSWGGYQSGYGQLGQNDVIQRSSPTQIGALTNWSSVAAGTYYCLARKTDGTIWAWGRNNTGALGQNDTIYRSSPVQVGTDTNWSSVFATNLYGTSNAVKTDNSFWGWGYGSTIGVGYGSTTTNRSSPTQVGAAYTFNNISVSRGDIATPSTIGIKPDGTLWAWGGNQYGQLAQVSDKIYRSSPVQVGVLTNWSSSSAGRFHVVAVKNNGSIWSWGQNNLGQLGLGDSIYRSSPIQIGTNNNWSSITSSYLSNFAIKTDGTLWAWGNNQYGGFGVSTLTVSGNTNSSSPVQVGKLPWKKLYAGSQSTFGIKFDGTLWGWGYNSLGLLGQNNSIYRSSPVQIGTLSNWLSIAASYHLAAIKTDGTLWTCGRNGAGALGQNDVNINKSSPIQVGILTNWLLVTTSLNNTFAIKTNGTLWAWGANASGQIGDPTITLVTNRSSPVQIGTLTNWSSVTSCAVSTAHAIKTDGTLWAWGLNTSGQLGDGTVINRSSPVQIGTGTNWLSISNTGAYNITSVLAIKTDGTLWAWGYNGNATLGDSSQISRSSPVQVGALTNWSSVTTTELFSSAVKNDGTLWAWGQNTTNVMGTGNTGLYISPVQVGLFNNWVKVYSGHTSTIGLFGNPSTIAPTSTWIAPLSKNLYNLWSWGRNNSGELGQNDVIQRSSPVQVGSNTNWYLISSDTYSNLNSSLAITNDGSLWAWGYNSQGQLGLNDSTTRSSPVQVSSSILYDYTDISSGVHHTLALKNDNTIWSWGYNAYAQLGQNDIINRSSPTQIGSLTSWLSVAAGFYQSYAIKNDNTLWGWGLNTSGQLGINIVTNRSSPVQVGVWPAITESIQISNNSSAIKTDGTLWTWGLNSSGQLGLGNVINRSSPVQVGALTNWSLISSSGFISYAIKTDGSLWAWGNNGYGSLGQNDTIYRSSPIQVGALTNWLSVAAGSYYAVLALKTDGTLWGWGNNLMGQIGDGTGISKSSPVQIGLYTNWLNISSSGVNSLALKTDGTLWSWGANSAGQLGQNDAIQRSSPVQIGTDTNWSKSISTNYNMSAAIKTDGTLWIWGNNANGALGLGNVINRSSPTQVGALNTWKKISTNIQVAAIKTDGTLWAWGYNTEGELGLGDKIFRSSPTQIGNLTNWLVVAAGVYNNFAIKTDGTLWSWGLNNSGSLGSGTVVSRSSPVQVGALTNWGREGVTASSGSSDWSKVFSGYYAIFALKTNGTLWAWGVNTSYGNLGLGDVINRSSPVQVGTGTNWSKVSATQLHTLALKTDSSLWSWGMNAYAQLGLNDGIYRSSPTQIGNLTTWSKISVSGFNSAAIKTDGTLWVWGGPNAGALGLNDNIYRSSPTQLGTDTNWSIISGFNAARAAIKTDGTLWAWGYNTQGQLGLGDKIYRSSPVQVGTDTNWSFLDSGSQGLSKIAKKYDGTSWAWGYNAYGQIGDGTIIDRSSPVQILSLRWTSVSSGGGKSLAVKNDGTLWSWGRNDSGQLGLGDVINRSSPTQVGLLKIWLKVAAGSNYSVAITSDSSLWTWGYNVFGQLGLGDVINRSSPVQIGGLYTWLSVAAGRYHTLVTKTDRSLWAWGLNSFGQLGDNTIISRSSPVQVGSLFTWLSVAAGNYHTLVTKTDGSLWTWGVNSTYGQLGLNDKIQRSSPVQVGTLTTWLSVAAGYDHSGAIKTDGSLWTWGKNSTYGALGDGTLIAKSSPVQIGSSNYWSVIYGSYDGFIALQNEPIRNI